MTAETPAPRDLDSPEPRAAAGGRALLYALTALAALAALQKVGDPDLWWHLTGGRLLFAQGFPHVNTFSHTWPEYPWQYTQWLFGAALRLLELLGGPAAAGLAPVLLVGAAFALSLDTVRRRLGGLSLAPLLPLLVLVLSASRFRFVPRPHLITFVGLALVLNLRERGARRLPLWFGVIGLVWANCHAGVVFGLGLVAMMPLADALAGRRAAALAGLAAAAAFAAGTLVNPYGLYPYLYSLQHLSVQDIVPLSEFRHAALRQETTFYLLAACALLAIPSRLRRKDFLYPLSALAFFLLAVDAVRLIPKFLIVVWPGLATAAAEGWASAVGRRRWPATAGAVLLLVCAAWLAVRDYQLMRAFNPVGWGLDEKRVPEGAANFILERNLEGRMFNEFDDGGYLIWRLYPARRVFVDGRVQSYPPGFFREFQTAVHGRSLTQFLERYRVDYAVVQRRSYGSRIDLSGAFRGIGWPLVYFDGNSYLYLRPGTPAAAKLSPFSIVVPGSRDADLVARARATPAAVLAELGRVEPERLAALEDFQLFGVAAATAGDGRLAGSFLQAGVRAHPESAILRLNLGTVLLEQGRQAEAGREFSAAAELGKGTAVGDAARRRLDGPR